MRGKVQGMGLGGHADRVKVNGYSFIGNWGNEECNQRCRDMQLPFRELADHPSCLIAQHSLCHSRHVWFFASVLEQWMSYLLWGWLVVNDPGALGSLGSSLD